ncbi:hypothetical protein L1286_17645 [Pseudoalteromonas sp. SMS1]|uniref:hypothetical protein n=1 Tax=Pseudoalteromonas sp. SMS1 TaxID=2908894 RepID=UPI001F3FD09D|nr:hypothetical protein [Pseudoalteromonas sp. SMS1]MCF2859312.1 hypothetical protein [Pseudoalteromonas sp. SMS1]
MGIRSALRKELMNLDALGLMTADDVRAYLNTHLKRAQDKLTLISRFNTHHSQVQVGLPSTEKGLVFEKHRLFKDVLYPKSSVQKWVATTQ